MNSQATAAVPEKLNPASVPATVPGKKRAFRPSRERECRLGIPSVSSRLILYQCLGPAQPRNRIVTGYGPNTYHFYHLIRHFSL